MRPLLEERKKVGVTGISVRANSINKEEKYTTFTYSKQEKCKSKLCWDNTSHLSDWQKFLNVRTCAVGKAVEKKMDLHTAGGSVNGTAPVALGQYLKRIHGILRDGVCGGRRDQEWRWKRGRGRIDKQHLVWLTTLSRRQWGVSKVFSKQTRDINRAVF